VTSSNSKERGQYSEQPALSIFRAENINRNNHCPMATMPNVGTIKFFRITCISKMDAEWPSQEMVYHLCTSSRHIAADRNINIHCRVNLSGYQHRIMCNNRVVT